MARAKKTTTTAPAAPVRHRPAIRRGAGTLGRVYQLVCSCGQSGREHAARRMAQVDLNAHLLALPPVPAAQQCHNPKQHDRRGWEPCGICEHQTALFDLEVDR
ncbi:hypothetical protein ACFV0L_43590 [Streptosporangium canum]|uniref:hypothetical protein n=1 Tax=Streptosporangium canum TaxID=324952 RepID=UPI0036C989E7